MIRHLRKWAQSPLPCRLVLLAALATAQPLTAYAGSPVAGTGPEAHQSASPASPGDGWATAWAAAPSDAIAPLATGNPPPFADMTLRTTLRLSLGGGALRVRISNDLGTEPLVIGAASVRQRGAAGFVPLRFGGQAGITIPPGQSVLSDGAALPVKALDPVQVSVYVPGPVARLTGHAIGRDPTWIDIGNQALRDEQATGFPGFSPLLLTQVDVQAAPNGNRGTIAALGDSITDGYLASFDSSRRWPDILADRLQQQRQELGVANLGISGNRLLRDGDGISVLHRLDRDVWSLSGLKVVVLFIGVNDLGHAFAGGTPMPSPAELISGYRQVIAGARARGVPIVAATIPPYGRAYYHDRTGGEVRNAVNRWIREGKEFDAVVDLDKICADPREPEALSPACDGGDGLHPSDSGYLLIGNGIAQVLATLPALQSR